MFIGTKQLGLREPEHRLTMVDLMVRQSLTKRGANAHRAHIGQDLRPSLFTFCPVALKAECVIAIGPDLAAIAKPGLPFAALLAHLSRLPVLVACGHGHRSLLLPHEALPIKPSIPRLAGQRKHLLGRT
jgi:hypothetical protein